MPAWADGFLRIGQQQQTSPAAARKEAEKFVDELYGHGRKPVLMKPVNTTSKPFRTTRAGVVSSFVGGNEEFPEDTGFAIGPVRWDAIRFDNVGFSVEGSQALAMGHYHFRDSFTGNESALEYTFGYFRDEDGKLRINFHFASAPYRNHSNQTNSDDITAEQVKAALKTFGDTIVDIGKYYAKGSSNTDVDSDHANFTLACNVSTAKRYAAPGSIRTSIKRCSTIVRRSTDLGISRCLDAQGIFWLEKLPILVGRRNASDALEFKVLSKDLGTELKLTLPKLAYWQYVRGKGKVLRERPLPEFTASAETLRQAKEVASRQALEAESRRV
eukprot:s537_g2.t1